MKKKILALCLVVVLVATAITGVTLAYFTDTTEVVENTFTMGKVKIDLDEAKVVNGEKTSERVKENDYTDIKMVPGHVFPKDPTIHVEKGSEKSYVFLDVTINKYKSLFWVMAADASADGNIDFSIFDGEGKLKAEFKKDGKDLFSSTAFQNALAENKTLRLAVINKWFNGIEHTNWTIRDIKRDGDYLTVRFAYNSTVDAKNDQVDIKFMDSFQMPASVTQEMIENGKKIGGMQNNFNTEKTNFKMNFVAYAIQADEMTDVDAAYAAMFG